MARAVALRYSRKYTGTVEQIWYRLEPPFNHDGDLIEHVIVSVSDIPEYQVLETMIFRANDEGEMVCLYETLPGALRAQGDHKAALKELGYPVIQPTTQFTLSYLQNRETQ